jgi:hypothetical protein
MDTDNYWVEISQNGFRLGAGFLLTRCYAVTAFHCLAGMDSSDDRVDVIFATNETLPGCVYRRSPEADLALIDIPNIGGNLTKAPNADRAGIGEKWHSPYRPSASHAYLSGKVAAAPIEYRCEGGDIIEAIQLGCTQSLGDYSGYSGGPVERSRYADGQAVLGILVEQYPEQYPDPKPRTRASTVLFAATITEIFRRFECFDVGHLLNILDPPHTRPSPKAPWEMERRQTLSRAENDSNRSEVASTSSRVQSVTTKLEALDDWHKRGLLGELDVSALRLQTIKYLIEDGIEG